MSTRIFFVPSNASQSEAKVRRLIKHKMTAMRLATGYRLNQLSVALYCRSRHMISKCLYTAEPNNFTESLRVLHRQIDAELKSQRRSYKAKRYAYGYPYQALHVLRVFGARSTEDRWDAYGLSDILGESDRVLDLGANCGFMSLYSVYRTGCQADCVDINPFMLNIGGHCAKALRVDSRMRFIESGVDTFDTTRKYTVIFSFAAHMTEDGQHQPDLVSYLRRIGSWMEPNGLIVFETHGYDSESSAVRNAMDEIQQDYRLERTTELFGGQRELLLLRKQGVGARCDAKSSQPLGDAV